MIPLGEAYCEMTLPDGPGEAGPLYTPRQVLERAEARFTEALQLAQQSNTPDMVNMARVGRARVRLALGNWDGVIEDASAVPANYLKTASRGDQEARRYNHQYNTANSRVQAATGPSRRTTGTSGSTRRAARSRGRSRPGDQPERCPAGGEGVADTRVTVVNHGRFGHNETTPLWHNVKYTSRTHPGPDRNG
jgi:hypothetical protein